MTKRFANFENNKHKRAKTENLEELWGDDDLDVKDIDDCFALATQETSICTQRNNVSVLPSYTSFKKLETRGFTSTQNVNVTKTTATTFTSFNGSKHNQKKPFTTAQSAGNLQGNLQAPSTSKTVSSVSVQDKGIKRTQSFDSTNTNAHLEMQIKKITKEYESKIGEVGILRSQLRQLKDVSEHDHKNKEKEWSAKLSSVQKELNVVKSKLEFKNLEIANLKQKIVDVSKLHESKKNNECLNKIAIQSTSNLKPQNLQEHTNIHFENLKWKIKLLSRTGHPLKDTIPSSIFNYIPEEKYQMPAKSNHFCTNAMPFLQYQMLQEETERLIRLQPPQIMLENDEILTFKYAYSEVLQLINCNAEEFQSSNIISCINKVLCTSYQFISNLHQFLRLLEDDFTTENIRQADIKYLDGKFNTFENDSSIFNPKKWIEQELGINARISLSFISELLPYSSYLKDCIIENEALRLTGHENYMKYLSAIRSIENQLNYLQLILSVTTLIGKLRLTYIFQGFLCAVLALSNKLCLFPIDTSMQKILFSIRKEIILSRPNLKVLESFSTFLHNSALNSDFTNSLCLTKTKLEQTQATFYCNKGSCVLQVFVALMKENKHENKELSRNIHMNLIKFASNVIRMNTKWFYYQEKISCDCPGKLVKYFIAILHKILREYLSCETYKQENRTLIQNGIKILNSMNTAACDLVVKDIETYSKYKFISYILEKHKNELNLDEFDVKTLEDLNTSEENLVDERAFSELSLWN